MVVFGQSGCIRAKVVVLGQAGIIRAKLVVFGQSSSIRANVLVFNGFNGAEWLYSTRVVLFGKSGGIWAKWF